MKANLLGGGRLSTTIWVRVCENPQLNKNLNTLSPTLIYVDLRLPHLIQHPNPMVLQPMELSSTRCKQMRLTSLGLHSLVVAPLCRSYHCISGNTPTLLRKGIVGKELNPASSWKKLCVSNKGISSSKQWVNDSWFATSIYSNKWISYGLSFTPVLMSSHTSSNAYL